MKNYPSAAWPSPKVATSIHSGAAAWARRNWHWLIVVIGLGKATRRTARSSWRAVRWAGRASVRATKWSAPRMARAAGRGGRATQARVVCTADALAAHARSKGRTVAADRWSRLSDIAGRRTQVTCGVCCEVMGESAAARHLEVHKVEMPRPQAGCTTLPVRHLTVVPTTAAGSTSELVSAIRPGTTAILSGGIQMTTKETQALARAATGVGQMDPGTAWDLDAQLAGMSAASLVLAENVGQYIETLNNIKTDPRVTAQAANAVAQLAELCKTFAVARQTFRALYTPQFEAAENGVRQIQRQGFFDPRNSSAA